jgi:hypothetical protein
MVNLYVILKPLWTQEDYPQYYWAKLFFVLYANVHSHVVEHRCVYVHFLILHVRREAKTKNQIYLSVKNFFSQPIQSCPYHQLLCTHTRQKHEKINVKLENLQYSDITIRTSI